MSDSLTPTIGNVAKGICNFRPYWIMESGETMTRSETLPTWRRAGAKSAKRRTLSVIFFPIPWFKYRAKISNMFG